MQSFTEAAISNGSSFILVSNDIEYCLFTLMEKVDNISLFPKLYKEQSDLLVDDVEDIFAEAYLTSESLKTIVLKSIKYNEPVQNRMLKILEEPPANIRFVILARTLSALLPTIRSRLPVFFLSAKKQEASMKFDFSSISIKTIFEFLKHCDRLDRDDARFIIYELLSSVLQDEGSKSKISTLELSKFQRAIELLALNGSPKIIIAELFLALLKLKNSK